MFYGKNSNWGISDYILKNIIINLSPWFIKNLHILGYSWDTKL